jgi:ribosomal protein L11 methyltransferase
VAVDGIERWNLREQEPPTADVWTANLMRPLLLRVAELTTEPPRALIASGLLGEEAEEVAAAFERHGLDVRRRLDDCEWCALLLERPLS